jgi:hypothetical protein
MIRNVCVAWFFAAPIAVAIVLTTEREWPNPRLQSMWALLAIGIGLMCWLYSFSEVFILFMKFVRKQWPMEKPRRARMTFEFDGRWQWFLAVIQFSCFVLAMIITDPDSGSRLPRSESILLAFVLASLATAFVVGIRNLALRLLGREPPHGSQQLGFFKELSADVQSGDQNVNDRGNASQ